MRKTVGWLMGAVAAVAAGPAGAAVLFDNPFNGTTGDCSFSTTCAQNAGRGNDYAAQLFSLSGPSTISSGSFTVLAGFAPSSEPHAVNYLFLSNDGVGGSPGTVLANGTQTVSARDSVFTGGAYNGIRDSFSITPLTLSGGSYYFAVQGVSSDRSTFLGTADGTGAYETHDGGATWSTGYQMLPAVAVSLSGSSSGPGAPAPLLGLGLVPALGSLGGLAATRWRRRKAEAA